jgi:hypothetical protein
MRNAVHALAFFVVGILFMVLGGCKGNGVVPNGEEGAPVAKASASSIDDFVRNPIHFSSEGSHAPDGGSISVYEWDWQNDGTYDSLGKEVIHSFNEPGTYTVKLTVLDNRGKTDDSILQITMHDFDPSKASVITPPWLNFSPIEVRMDGNYAYVLANVNGEYQYELEIFDISVKSTPRWVSRVSLPGELDISGIAAWDGYIYVATNDYTHNGNDHYIQIIDANPPETAAIAGEIAIPTYFSSDESIVVADGYAYVLVEYSKLDIISLSPHGSEHIVNTIDMGLPKSFFAAADGYVYALDNPSYGSNNLDIIDVDPPESASSVGMIEIGGNASNVGPAASNGFVYIPKSIYNPGDSSAIGEVVIVDATQPDKPFIASSVSTSARIETISVENGYIYAGSNYPSIVHIIDATSPGSAYIASTVVMPASVNSIAVSNGYASVTGPDYGLSVIDIDPPGSVSIVGNATIIADAEDVVLSGNYAYVAAGDAGLAIVDISSPDNSKIAGWVRGIGAGYLAVQDGYAYVTSGKSGSSGRVLSIIDIDPLESAHVVQSVPMQGAAQYVALMDGYAYVSDGWKGVEIVDIDPPESASLVKRAAIGEGAVGQVTALEGYLFVPLQSTMKIIDVNDPANPSMINTIPIDGGVGGMVIWNGLGFAGGAILDINPPESTHIIKVPGFAVGPGDAIASQYLFAAGHSPFSIYDMGPYGRTVASLDIGGTPSDIELSGGYAYVSTGSAGLQIVKIF